ncbi:MAG: LysR family transcriptional regulator [Bosea sp.]|nr:LysR family transcriptional regulator [Bosea sp. (in: a-proteobacteria)]
MNLKPFEIGQDGLVKSALEDPVILSGRFWDELRVFLAVAKLGSFAKAGDALGMGTATVSRHVKRLQDQLRAQLIVAGRTGSKLTPDGASLARALSELDHKVFSIASNFRTNNRDVEGTVRVSVTEGLAGVFLASKLAAFHAIWPGICLHLKTPINLMSLRENRADMMVGFEPVEASDIACVPLGHLHLIPIASEQYIRRNGAPKLGDLSHHVFVDSQFYQARTGMWTEWQYLMAQGRVSANCDSSLSYASAVLGGLGIGLLGNYTLSDSTLRHLMLGVHVSVPIYLLGLTERLEARPVRVVADWLADTFGPHNPWFAEELNLRPDTPTSFLAVMGALLGEPPGDAR